MKSPANDPRLGMKYHNPASDAKGQATVVDRGVSSKFSRAVVATCCWTPAVEAAIERSQGMAGILPQIEEPEIFDEDDDWDRESEALGN